MPTPVILIVRDGWGHNPHPEHDPFNAVKLADTPRSDGLMAKYPSTLIHTSGEDVGLPPGTMGNSEVGHQNLGAGRVVDQESVRISKAIRTGSFFENPVLVQSVQRAKQTGKAVHLMGIASDAGVHGLLDHLYACAELCKREGVGDRVWVHLFTDGRDTGPYTGKDYVGAIQAKLDEIGVGRVVSIVGRYFAMDRDNRWERVKQAYDLLTGRGQNPRVFTDPEAAVQDYYDHPTNPSQGGDEFITSRVVSDTGTGDATRITEGDTVIFYNYRGDRPREIIRAFTLPDDQWAAVTASPDSGEPGFDRGRKLDLAFVTMTAYQESLPVKVAYPKPPKMADIGGAYLAGLDKTQFRGAETEKFPHVTFFFNDYREQPLAGETRKMAQSPRVATYDLKPEMSAFQVRDFVLERLGGETPPDFILVNFANGDMVGHTGNLDAAIKAVETVDQCVGEIVDATLAKQGKLIVTADHGNAEQMFDPQTHAPHTAHTLYDVPCIVVGEGLPPHAKLREGGRLADVFPTVLDLMGLDKPDAMTGTSLLA